MAPAHMPTMRRLKLAWMALLLMTFLLVASYTHYFLSNQHYTERSYQYCNCNLTHTLPDSLDATLLYTRSKTMIANKTCQLQEAQNTVHLHAKMRNLQPSKYSAVTEQLIRNAAGKGKEHCNISGIRSWQQGLVTTLHPEIEMNCLRLIDRDQGEVDKVRKQLQQWRNAEPYDSFVNRMSNCSLVRTEFSNVFYVSPEERNFPLAYIIVIHSHVRQVIRLLKSIYRPQNLYCIHPDARQGVAFAEIFQNISKCLDNVFVASRLEEVYYEHISVMGAQLSCMRDLMEYPAPRWKYAINICGTELPLKTNREIVTSLKKLNGSSAIGDAHKIEPFLWNQRFIFKYALNCTGQMHWTPNKLDYIPHNISIFKSLTYIAASRPFVGFLLESEKAVALRNYLTDVRSAEEHFYSSLYALPEAPGGRPKDGNVQVPIVTKALWIHNQTYAWKHCKERIVHKICILSYDELPVIFRYGVYSKIPFFFFNKYFMKWDHTVMDCVEERLVNANMEEYKQDCTIQ